MKTRSALQHAASIAKVVLVTECVITRVPHQDDLLQDARQLNDTVAYVKYLSHPRDRGGWALGHIGPLAEGAAIMIFGLGTLLLVTRWIGTRT